MIPAEMAAELEALQAAQLATRDRIREINQAIKDDYDAQRQYKFSILGFGKKVEGVRAEQIVKLDGQATMEEIDGYRADLKGLIGDAHPEGKGIVQSLGVCYLLIDCRQVDPLAL